MALAAIKRNHMRFNGVLYFRGHAPAVVLGHYGRKKCPLPRANYLEPYDHVGLAGVALSPAVVTDINMTGTTDADIGGEFDVAGAPFSGDLSAKIKALKNKELRLVLFAMTLRQVQDSVEDDTQDDFERIGGKARVAHEVWVVMAAKEAQKFSSGASLRASVEEAGVSVTANLGHTSESTIVLSPGSTYAYLLCKRRNDGMFTTDQWGAG